MKAKLLLATLVAALTASFVAVAADEPATDTPPAKAAAAKKKVKPHSHLAEKGMPVPAEKTADKGPVKKPAHDHQADR